PLEMARPRAMVLHPFRARRTGRTTPRIGTTAAGCLLDPPHDKTATLAGEVARAVSKHGTRIRSVHLPNVKPDRTAAPTQKEETVSNHFTGLSLGPPLGDQRLDLCDLYAFLSPTDPTRTVIILNANPNADALHPDAIYRLNIDN